MSDSNSSWTVTDADAGQAVSAYLRARTGKPWSQVQRLFETGKVFVDGAPPGSAGVRLRAGQVVEVRMRAPRPRDPQAEVRIVYEDAHVVVIDKPAGVSSVPYEKREQGTAMDLIRDAWRRMGRPATDTPLIVVHRIDRATSGLLVFARSKKAERGLGQQFRTHTTERTYLCVAHGRVRAGRIESRLVADRGDGLRGSARHPNQGKRAVTHVTPLRELGPVTLCEVRLETGRTHQIRIHLAEAGHPLLGEPVYIRDYPRDGQTLIPWPRLMLHAHTLGFAHPLTNRPLTFRSETGDFFTLLDRLQHSG